MQDTVLVIQYLHSFKKYCLIWVIKSKFAFDLVVGLEIKRSGDLNRIESTEI